MSSLPPWIERKFNFDVAVALYPNILARVRGTPPRLEDAVRGLMREQLIDKPEGKWSIQENAGHLLDEEALFSRRLDEYLAGAAVLTPAPYLDRELTYNDWEIATIVETFRQVRERQVQRVAVLRLEDFARSCRHERLGISMRLVDHLYFIAEHDDHHLGRIWELREIG